MKRLIAILKLGVLLPLACTAQSASPAVYSAAGGSGTAGNMIIDYTVGECMVMTLDPQNGTNILTQGFHQPINDSIIGPGSPDSLLGIYNGLTANGDGHNDTWIISGIDTLPDNEVFIHNRWGELVWKGSKYDNVSVVWDGKNSQGAELISGTYYYVIIIKNRKNYAGWVELSR
jgi:gliding motility-associated-like protein